MSAFVHYLDALGLVHTIVQPRTYCEIGCRLGVSLALSRCPSVAIDPDFDIQVELGAPTRIFKATSDDFFASHDLSALLGEALDFGFIDGFHNVEFALRDFINLERHSHPGGIIAIDDVLPPDDASAERIRRTQVWTGDVYRLVPILRAFRPDLEILVYDVEMKGLALITKLDPTSTILAERLEEIIGAIESGSWAFDTVDTIRRELAPQPVATLRTDLEVFSKARSIASTNATAASDYLDLLKRSILNEIYLDDEARILYLRASLAGEDTFDYAVLHDIRRRRPDLYLKLAESREIGRFYERKIANAGFSHSMMGRKRLDSLHECLDQVRTRNIPGDAIECGVWRGGACIFIAGYFSAHGMRDRRVFVADSFEGLPASTHPADPTFDLSKSSFPQLAVSLESVRDNFAAYGLDRPNVHYLPGWFNESLSAAPIDRIALLRLDGDLYASTMDALHALYDKVSAGGIVIVDDYGAVDSCRLAVENFFDARKEAVPNLHHIDWTGVWFEKP